MTGRERVLAAIEGKPLDRLPFMPITMMFAAGQIGVAGDRVENPAGVVGQIDALVGDRVAAGLVGLLDAGDALQVVVRERVNKVGGGADRGRDFGYAAGGVIFTRETQQRREAGEGLGLFGDP